jgi:hypothetical protein
MAEDLIAKLKKMVGEMRSSKCDKQGKVTTWTFCTEKKSWSPDTYYWQCDECSNRQYVKR